MCFSGFGWIQNLTLPDETLLIPFLVGMSLFLNNEINTNRYKPDFINKGNRIKLKFESLRVVFILIFIGLLLYLPPIYLFIGISKEPSTPDKTELAAELVKLKKERKVSPHKDEFPSSTSDKASKDPNWFQSSKMIQFYEGLSKYVIGLNQDYITNVFRLLSIAMVPIAAMVPSAVSCYWAASGITAIVVNLTLLSPKVREIVRIPRLPESSSTPYKDLLNNMRERTNNSILKVKIFFKMM